MKATDSLSWFEYITKCLPIIISLIAVAISYSSFRLSKSISKNYDVKKINIQKQVEITLNFYESFENTIFTILEFQQKIAVSVTRLAFKQINKEYIKVLKETYNDTPLAVSEKFEKVVAFPDYINNVFLPKTIADEVLKLKYHAFTDDDKEFTLLLAEEMDIHETREQFRLKRLKLMDFTGTYANMHSFLEQVLRIKEVTDNWIKKFDVTGLNVTN